MRRLVLVLVAATACDAKPSEPAPASTPSPSTADDLGAMTEYMRKSKAAEAKVFVGTIARNVAMASEELRMGPDGTAVPVVLQSVGPTPPVGTCCKQPKGRCAADPKQWDVPAWKAIAFELSEPHYYSYELVALPGGFTARAIGDLDCDGELATFELRGTARPDGTYEIAGTPTSDKPTE